MRHHLNIAIAHPDNTSKIESWISDNHTSKTYLLRIVIRRSTFALVEHWQSSFHGSVVGWAALLRETWRSIYNLRQAVVHSDKPPFRPNLAIRQRTHFRRLGEV